MDNRLLELVSLGLHAEKGLGHIDALLREEFVVVSKRNIFFFEPDILLAEFIEFGAQFPVVLFEFFIFGLEVAALLLELEVVGGADEDLEVVVHVS